MEKAMKRLAMIALMSMTAFFVTACGDNSKKPEMNAAQEQPAADAAAAPEAEPAHAAEQAAPSSEVQE